MYRCGHRSLVLRLLGYVCACPRRWSSCHSATCSTCSLCRFQLGLQRHRRHQSITDRLSQSISQTKKNGSGSSESSLTPSSSQHGEATRSGEVSVERFSCWSLLGRLLVVQHNPRGHVPREATRETASSSWSFRSHVRHFISSAPLMGYGVQEQSDK